MDNRRIPLEDTWLDVIGKACRGQQLNEKALAQRALLSIAEASRLLGGDPDPSALEKAARALGLHHASLLALARGEYHPGAIALPKEMAMFGSDWGSMQVHSYLAWDEKSRDAVAFDTGADATELLSFLKDHGLMLRLLLLTHGHGAPCFRSRPDRRKTGAEAWNRGG